MSGDLDATVGGPSKSLRDEENNRRTIYGEVSRFQVDEFLQTFDFPNPSLSAERRYTTNVPGQSLYFMNSPFVRRQAELFVKRLLDETAPENLVAEDGEEGSGGVGTGNGQVGNAGVGNGGAANGSNGNGASGDHGSTASGDHGSTASGDHGTGAAGGDETDDASVFRDRERIEAAYPLLYSRDVTEAEIAAGLEFLEERRAAFLAEELAKLEDESSDEAEAEAEADESEEEERAAGTRESGEAAGDDETAEAAGTNEDEDTPGHRASMQAWIQYARALFSVAEFRFVD